MSDSYCYMSKNLSFPKFCAVLQYFSLRGKNVVKNNLLLDALLSLQLSFIMLARFEEVCLSKGKRLAFTLTWQWLRALFKVAERGSFSNVTFLILQRRPSFFMYIPPAPELIWSQRLQESSENQSADISMGVQGAQDYCSPNAEELKIWPLEYWQH